MLTDQQVKKFQDLYEKHFGEKIDQKEAFRRGTEIVDLMRNLIASSQDKKKKEKREEILLNI